MTLCKTCGKETRIPDMPECENCWQVEGRLDDYLKSSKGLAFVRKHLPLLDDWENGYPDAWDYDKILRENEVEVSFSDMFVDGEGHSFHEPEFGGWSLSWKQGVIFIGDTSAIKAKKAAALFVSLWLRGVSASFADKLMSGYLMYLDLQDRV